MDTPTPRTIRIGNATIGLLGFDTAMNQALAARMEESEAVSFILEAVKTSNYIPASMLEKYREAISREYRKLTGQGDESSPGLTIRILGSGCISCNSLQTLVIDAMERAGIAADIEQIHDRDEIWRLGVMATPALMINGQVKIAGIKPTLAQIVQWIREESLVK
jgi:small redox-active disulfide protein 2